MPPICRQHACQSERTAKLRETHHFSSESGGWDIAVAGEPAPQLETPRLNPGADGASSGRLSPPQRLLDQRGEGRGRERLGEIGRGAGRPRGEAARFRAKPGHDDRRRRRGRPTRRTDQIQSVAIGETDVGDEQRERLALDDDEAA
jgi:hypothetical protein